jgi:hypothetical protein
MRQQNQPLMADPRASEEVKRQVEAQRTKLDPVRLLSDIRAVQQRLVEIADTVTAPSLLQTGQNAVAAVWPSVSVVPQPVRGRAVA